MTDVLLNNDDESILCDCSFLFNDNPTPEEIERERKLCPTAAQWKSDCELYYTNVDADEQYRIKLEENRQEKIKHCGAPFFYLDPQTGTWRFGTSKCGICPHCLSVETGAIRQAVLETSLKQSLRLTITGESERAKTVRRIKAHGFDWQLYVVETDGGSIECHILTNDPSIGEEFDAKSWDYRQWAKHFKADDRRNSGKLIGSNRSLVRGGEQKEDENIIDSGQVLLREIHPEFPELPQGIPTIQRAMQAAGDYAIWHTRDMAPQDIDELQECIRKREDLAIEAIRLMGGVIYGISFRRTSTLKMTLELPQQWLNEAKKHNITQWQHLLE